MRWLPSATPQLARELSNSGLEVQLLEPAQDGAGRLLALLISSGFHERAMRLSEQ
jgi:hypothetical protein